MPEGDGGRGTLSLGDPILDSKLGGGVQSGSILTIQAEGVASPEIFLYMLTETRETVYVTTDRSEEEVREEIASFELESPGLDFLDLYRHHFFDGGDLTSPTLGRDPEDTLQFLLENLPEYGSEPFNLIIDSYSLLRHLRIGRRRERMILNTINETVKSSGGLCTILHYGSFKGTGSPLEVSSDSFLRAQVDETGEGLEKRLYVPKLREGSSPREFIPYHVERGSGLKMSTGKKI